MAEYHWNEPNDFMALLDTSSSLPPFDNPTPPLPDFFGLEQPPLDTAVPTPALLDDSLFCDGLQTAPDIPTPPSILDVPNFEIAPSVAQVQQQQHQQPHQPLQPTTTVTTAPPAVDNPPSEHGSEHDNSGVPPAPSTPGASSETIAGMSNSLSSAASDVTAGVSAVDMARKAAEDFANSKVSERKRRMGRRDDGEDDDVKRRKGHDGSPCSDGDDDAPEKVSHRKYQKRLQKNRDSAYVSRIRRREYTKRLEDGLNRMEKEKIDVQSKYEALQRKFDVVVQELKTMKEATAAKFRAVAGPVGAAGRSATKSKSAGAIFMCIIIFGLCLPGTSPWRTEVSETRNVGRNVEIEGLKFVREGQKGRVWSGMEPIPMPKHWGCGDDGEMNNIASNVTLVFGKENGGEMMRLLKNRVRNGAVDKNVLGEVKEKSSILAKNMDRESVKRTLPSRRSKLLRTVLRKLASVADECFTKELIALLTIRLLPNEATAKLGK